MTIFTSNYVKFSFLSLLCLTVLSAHAQKTDSLFTRQATDTSISKMNMDAVYTRPFLNVGKSPVAVGGYLEANSIYCIEDGLTEGLSFQARRLTVFMSASISKRIKFLTEIEFEEGGKEIAIEFAAMDIAFHPLVNLRGGIIMNPIGAFNQNHDGPKWEFVERPTVAVGILPATLSNSGFGLYGKAYSGNWIVGYEAYLTNGFDNSIINNENNKTYLPAVKANTDRFEESASGKAMLSAKIALKNRQIGEIGLSYMGGVYNRIYEDGLQIDTRLRRVDVFAVDFNTTIAATGTYIVGEATKVFVDVPTTYTQQYGNTQQGFFVDVVQPILKRKILDWENATLNLAARVDYADWNVGTFKETGTKIGDELWAITPAVSFRPTSQTVLRLNYRYQWQKDILNNAPALAATWYFGFSTYF